MSSGATLSQPSLEKLVEKKLIAHLIKHQREEKLLRELSLNKNLNNENSFQGQSINSWTLKVVNVSWIIICFLAMVYHTSGTTRDYLGYPVTTQFGVKLDYKFRVPMAGICFNPESLLNGPKICGLDGNGTTESRDKCFYEMLAKMSLKQLTDKLTNDLVSRVDNVDKKLTIRTFFKKFFCLDIGAKVTSSNLSSLTRGDSRSKRLMVIDINMSNIFIKWFSITLHHPNVYPRGISIKSLELIYGNTIRTRYQIGFTRVTTTNLPAPFFTRCVDYTGERESSHDCLDQCANKFVIEHSEGKYHPQILLSNDHYRDDVYFDLKHTAANYSYLHDDLCGPKCPTDCITTNFYARNIDNVITDPDHLYIAIDYMDPNLAINYVPRFTLSEYVIYVASIMGLWFGLALYSAMESGVKSLVQLALDFNNRSRLKLP